MQTHTYRRLIRRRTVGTASARRCSVVARCAVLCLRQRLETVTCGRSFTAWIPLRLLGETNEALVTLRLHDCTRSLRDDLSCLLGCVALRELSLQGTQVTNESFAGLGPLLARLHKLDLSWCKQLKAISNLAPATSLRELNLAHSGVADLRRPGEAGRVGDAGCDQHSHRGLVHPAAVPSTGHAVGQGDITALESIIHAAAPSLVDCRLHIDRPVKALDSRSLSCLRRSTVLKFSDLDNASLQGLEEIPSLEQLDLERTSVDDVRSLAGCRALRELKLTSSSVTDVGIIGLERIATLEVLNLASCRHITSVTSLRHCTALRELILDRTMRDRRRHRRTRVHRHIDEAEPREHQDHKRVLPAAQSFAAELDISNTELTAAARQASTRSARCSVSQQAGRST
jgi:hypothetical protein